VHPRVIDNGVSADRSLLRLVSEVVNACLGKEMRCRGSKPKPHQGIIALLFPPDVGALYKGVRWSPILRLRRRQVIKRETRDAPLARQQMSRSGTATCEVIGAAMEGQERCHAGTRHDQKTTPA